MDFGNTEFLRLARREPLFEKEMDSSVLPFFKKAGSAVQTKIIQRFRNWQEE